jgi:hypothetical protein
MQAKTGCTAHIYVLTTYVYVVHSILSYYINLLKKNFGSYYLVIVFGDQE